MAAHIYPGHWNGGSRAWYTNHINTCLTVYPVFMSEWGFRQNASNSNLRGTITNYGQPLMNFCEERKISSSAWVADYSWEPRMFNSNWKLRCGEGEMGGFTKDWLYEKRVTALITCSPFYCSMGSKQIISDCNGTINGALTFVGGVNGKAANFNGASKINYAGNIFDVPSGSVSFWFKKNANDEHGGIMEIGSIGSPNSLGIFYNNSKDVFFEIKNDKSDTERVIAPNVISQTEFTHIVAVWDKRGNTYCIKLFIDGICVGWPTLTGPFTHSQRPMKIGATGFYGNGKGIIDELRFFNWNLSDGEVYAEYVYSSNRHRYQPTGKPVSKGPVKVIGKTLTVNNKPFTVKGIGYQPIPIGSSSDKSTLNSIFTNKSIITRDVTYLKDMGVNTVRLWAELPKDMTLLNALQKAGIYAIVAFEIPSSDDDPNIDYSKASTIAYYKNKIKTYVNQFKTHPAVSQSRLRSRRGKLPSNNSC
jgi:hypothetical protein